MSRGRPRGQSSSEEMQNSVERLTEKIHEVAYSFSYFLRRVDNRQLFSFQPKHAAQEPSGQRPGQSAVNPASPGEDYLLVATASHTHPASSKKAP
jgi:hypothetical protein